MDIQFKAQQVADKVLASFDEFYNVFLNIPEKARAAFENRDHPESLRLSASRLQLYSKSMHHLSDALALEYPEISSQQSAWDAVEKAFRESVEGRYHSDLALAYCHSTRRRMYQSEWRVEDYASKRLINKTDPFSKTLAARIPIPNEIDADVIRQCLGVEKFNCVYADFQHDIDRVVARVKEHLSTLQGSRWENPIAIEMIKGGFYRNRGAYLVGRTIYNHDQYRPFILALLNGEQGIYVDAVILSSTYAHNMFSSTLANFHVTNPYYHELCHFLVSVMPMRPIGLHYSTIGYNHLGKVAVISEIEEEIESTKEEMSVSPGTPGTVAIGFSAPSSAYHMKVIRNSPTDKYKWGKFEGIDSVLKKYSRVHDINRTDSMLDSIIFYNLKLSTRWFSNALLNELIEFAGESVYQQDDYLVFKYLIVQRKLTPLPVYLETATQRQAENVMVNLGYCIKNNAAANIFNRDLDARNYGVTSYSKVYLFDYDALEVLTEVKIRTNTDRFDGEEDIPDWYFEDGVVFLPEELVAGLCLPYRQLRRLFSDTHPELERTPYWTDIQQELSEGYVPRVSVYPESVRL